MRDQTRVPCTWSLEELQTWTCLGVFSDTSDPQAGVVRLYLEPSKRNRARMVHSMYGPLSQEADVVERADRTLELRHGSVSGVLVDDQIVWQDGAISRKVPLPVSHVQSSSVPSERQVGQLSESIHAGTSAPGLEEKDGTGCIKEEVPDDWADVNREGFARARDLFVNSWGAFDVRVAFHALQAQDRVAAQDVPSAAALVSSGYVIKFFPHVADRITKSRLLRIFGSPSTCMAHYLARYRSFFEEPANLNRLDELEMLFGGAPHRADLLEEDPRQLLNRLDRQHQRENILEEAFPHLVNLIRPFRIMELSMFELHVLDTSVAIRDASEALHNCGKRYISRVRMKFCILVVLKCNERLLAMGEWDLLSRKWMQVVECNNLPIRPEWLAWFTVFGQHLPKVELKLIHELAPILVGSFRIISPRAVHVLKPILWHIHHALENIRCADLLEIARCPEALAAVVWLCAGMQRKETDVEVICQLLRHVQKGPSLQGLIDAQGLDGHTLLMHSLLAEGEQMLRLLMIHRANTEVRNHEGMTALMVAATYGKLSRCSLSVLVEGGADLEATHQCGQTSLMKACQRGQVDGVQLLVEMRARIDIIDLADHTALVHAAMLDNYQVVQLLLQSKAVAESSDSAGRTPLMKAVSADSLATVQVLIDNMADLQARDDYGYSVQQCAKTPSMKKLLAELLVARGVQESEVLPCRDETGEWLKVRDHHRGVGWRHAEFGILFLHETRLGTPDDLGWEVYVDVEPNSEWGEYWFWNPLRRAYFKPGEYHEFEVMF
ncbi:unnamed protein product [Polarella glacialis]|uniref:Uncharacterized protein n=1 Tax=Polarella glacialis TaxID=89957 RepID=A0A813KML4_POLGL|nr:unnamed protein product [Polarella glacialis]